MIRKVTEIKQVVIIYYVNILLQYYLNIECEQNVKYCTKY